MRSSLRAATLIGVTIVVAMLPSHRSFAAGASDNTANQAAQVQGNRAPRPNIVFMLMDNVGYGELGVYGGGILRGARTPRIDKLASEGLRLLNFNVEAQCTPTRSALMTGRFPIRSGTYKVPLGGIKDG